MPPSESMAPPGTGVELRFARPPAQVGGLATGRVLRPPAGHSKRRWRSTRSRLSVAAVNRRACQSEAWCGGFIIIYVALQRYDGVAHERGLMLPHG